ncbi:alpha/beta hydrolase [Candidatus Uabimicrobium sp. HlEnr_7]|uniref:alpha/beta hydrolase n=1 Tax=Candidatus Uabimicrobium helgolandensis TaxID=3095367 RepID=UPI00355790CD
MFIFISIVIFNILMLIFAIYEYKVSWGKNENWCTQGQTLEPLKKNRKRSIIMIHGFGGSPFDFKPLALRLQEEGFTIRIPIMAGQNKNYFAYNRGQFSSEFFIAWLHDIIDEENERFDNKPYLVGFSMGGTVSTVVAQEENVEKLILLAPYYSLPIQNNTIVTINKVLGLIMPIVPKRASGQVNSDEGRNRYIPGTFIVSSLAFLQLNDLAIEARKIAPQLALPIFIAASKNDGVASFEKINDLFSKNTFTKIKEYPKSNHIMLYDYDFEEIIKDVVSFCVK